MTVLVKNGRTEMKHMVAALTVGACLLLPSAGIVLANDVHVIAGTKTTGQPGANFSGISGGNTCGNIGTGSQGMPGSGKGVGSPFGPNGPSKTYAGNTGNPTGPGGNLTHSGNAVSEYDVACFQATQHLP